MDQGPAELRRDIERRRDDLGDTIDAIGDRVSPGRILERRRNRMADSVRSIKDRVMGTISAGTEKLGDAAGSVRDHASGDAVKQQAAGAPLGVGLVAFGIGFLVAVAMPATEPETEVAQRLQDQLEPAKDALKETGQQLAQSVKGDVASAATDVKETATDAAGKVSESAQQQVEATKDDVRSVGS
jgi:gas vesicle protein